MDQRLLRAPAHNPWASLLETFIDHVTSHEALSDSLVLRGMMEVIGHAPHPGLVASLGRLDATLAETLLDLGASDTLALRLIGPGNGFFASRGAAGDYLVSVVLANGGEETTASGTTLLRAVVCALAQALVLQEQRHGQGHHDDHGPQRGTRRTQTTLH